jgi:hypothetical protein
MPLDAVISLYRPKKEVISGLQQEKCAGPSVALGTPL